EHPARRLREAGARRLPIGVAERVVEAACRVVLRQARDLADRQRGTKDLQVVAIDAVAQPGRANLIEALEAIEAVRVAIWHDQAVKAHGEARIAPRLNRRRVPQNAGPGRN